MKDKQRLLIVDDEPNIRRILQMAFEKAGYQASTAEDVPSALSQIPVFQPDCIITDVTMPGSTGYDLLRQVKADFPAIPVVIMTAFGTIPQAVQAMRDGAFEYVTKPFDLDALKKIVVAAVGEKGSKKSTASKPKSKSTSTKRFIAESEAMQEVYQTVQQVADSKATVLIYGESGVGKEVVAKSLHELSTRSAKPFVAVSCAALPDTLLESELFGYEKGAFTGANSSKPGRFEAASHGTLFLDEIGEIPLATQVKMLRVLQGREFERLGAQKPTKFEVRLVTATNRDLNEAVEQGIFRLDLLYRLQVVEIVIPPLRERVADIKPLAELFLEKFCSENGRDLLCLNDATLNALHKYAWPGNVRELENTIERAVVLAPSSERELSLKMLPKSIAAA